MKLWKKILLCLGCLVVIAGLVFAAIFLIKEYKIKQYSSYCGDRIRETLGDDIGNITMANVTEYSDYLNFTGTVSTEGVTYEYNCDVYGEDDVEGNIRPVYDDTEYNYGDDELTYDEFRNFLTQEPIEFSYNVTDEEAASYGWKYLDDSECYISNYLGIKLDTNPEKDENGRNINCVNASGEKEGVRIFNGLSLFGLMDYDNYTNGKKNGVHFSFYANGQKASSGYIKDNETDGDRTTFKQDGSIKAVTHYENGIEVENKKLKSN